MSTYHVPVMLRECLEGLDIREEGVYVDVTFGGGGHSKAILDRLSEKGKLYAFDRDPDAAVQAEKIDHPGFTLIKSDFRFLKRYLKLYRVEKIDGLLADFGVSSHQIDSTERGFSTRFDSELDMRMDKNTSEKNAFDVVNSYEINDLTKILKAYGEINNARKTAHAIAQARSHSPIRTTLELKDVVKPFAKRGREYKFFAQVFQALRIEVNNEIQSIEDLLHDTAELMKPGGRLVTMAYHSLEDRPVKRFLQNGSFENQTKQDLYGNVLRPFEPQPKKALTAREDEIALNPRARSAKLRIGIRNEFSMTELEKLRQSAI